MQVAGTSLCETQAGTSGVFNPIWDMDQVQNSAATKMPKCVWYPTPQIQRRAGGCSGAGLVRDPQFDEGEMWLLFPSPDCSYVFLFSIFLFLLFI